MNNTLFGPFEFATYGLSCSEFILHPAIISLSILNFLVLSSTGILHPNLRFILQCESIIIFASELSRLVWDACKFANGDIFISTPTAFKVLEKMDDSFI